MSAAVKTCPQCGASYDMEQRFCPRDGSTLRAPPGSDLVGSIIADRYHIIRRLGEGGMGQVYLAEHVKMRRKSAVKVLHPGMVHDPDAIARFNREASNASQIQHPNVAAIYDFGETTDGMIYLAMEFVDGEPLTKIIERQGALAAARTADIVHQVADALEAAHDIGIIHRDLKPDNIMIARGRSGEDVVKVVDFGIAKAMHDTEQKVTKTGLAIGTPEYMSPEQLGGDELDSRTDIYSLGLVAFNMFTGALPFPAVTSRESLILRLTEKPQTLAQVRADVQWPAELQGVMDRVLANHPGERYQHVSDFARDLVRAVASMPESRLAEGGTLAIEVKGAPAAATARSGGAAPSAPRRTPVRDDAPGPTTRETAREVYGASTGRRVLIAFVGLAAAVAVAGGVWYSRQARAAGTSGAAAGAGVTSSGTASAAGDSATRAGGALPGGDTAASLAAGGAAPRDSSAATHAADSTAVASTTTATDSAAGATRPGAGDTPPPADASALLAPIQDDIDVGRQRMSDGQYEGALVRFHSADERLTALLRKYPGVARFRAVRRDLTAAMRANHDACVAEKTIAEKRGGAGPDCP